MKSEKTFWLNHLGRCYYLANAVAAIIGNTCSNTFALKQETKVVARFAVLDNNLSLPAFREAQTSVGNNGFNVVARHSLEKREQQNEE